MITSAEARKKANGIFKEHVFSALEDAIYKALSVGGGRVDVPERFLQLNRAEEPVFKRCHEEIVDYLINAGYTIRMYRSGRIEVKWEDTP